MKSQRGALQRTTSTHVFLPRNHQQPCNAILARPSRAMYVECIHQKKLLQG